MTRVLPYPVAPATAGVQGKRRNDGPWVPACAGMTRPFDGGAR
jgi:hypothetical protein